MSSPYPKFLRQITVPTGGYDFAGDDGAPFVATVPAGEYRSVLLLCAELEDQINAEAVNETFTVAVSSTGTVTITATGAWTVTWASTDDALSTLLGFDESESVSAAVLTASETHRLGWYPGTISFGTTAGAGDTLGGDWVRDWPHVSRKAGSRAMRRVTTASPLYQRTVEFDLLSREEVLDPYRGLDGFERGFGQPVIWYPDRTAGTVAAPGTQGDPDTDPRDSSCDFWEVYLEELPTRAHRSESNAWRTVSLLLHAEPAP